MKKTFDLQKTILMEMKKKIEGKKFKNYIIEKDDDYIYVSESGYNVHKIYRSWWMLDCEKLVNYYRPGNALKKCFDKIPENYGKFTGMKKTGKFSGEKITLLEVINEDTGEKIYINEAVLKYVPTEYCYIKCSDWKTPITFIDSHLQEIKAIACPTNPRVWNEMELS